MDSKFTFVVGAIVVLLICGGLIGLGYNSMENKQRKYEVCVSNGGTWIDASNDLCVSNSVRVESQ